MHSFKIWVTLIYDVAVTVKLVQLNCLLQGLKYTWFVRVGHVNVGVLTLIKMVIFIMAVLISVVLL